MSLDTVFHAPDCGYRLARRRLAAAPCSCGGWQRVGWPTERAPAPPPPAPILEDGYRRELLYAEHDHERGAYVLIFADGRRCELAAPE